METYRIICIITSLPHLDFNLVSQYPRGKVFNVSNMIDLDFLIVQWLRLCFPRQVVWVQSLARELRSCMLYNQKVQNMRTGCNIVTNSIKTIKMVYFKK